MLKSFLSGRSQGTDNPELIPYKVKRDRLSVQDGCVMGCKSTHTTKGTNISASERHQAHSGICQMKSLAKELFFVALFRKGLTSSCPDLRVCQVNQNHEEEST